MRRLGLDPSAPPIIFNHLQPSATVLFCPSGHFGKTWGSTARWLKLSEDDVEAAAEKSMVRRKELTEAWVSGIGAHVARIEVIGCVEYSQRQSHAILLCQLKLFRYFRVE